MKTELEIFLEGFKESGETYFCDYSTDFEWYWIENNQKIKHLAWCFLSDNEHKNVEIGAFVLFLHEDHRIRIAFLKWAITKGYKTINDLFNK